MMGWLTVYRGNAVGSLVIPETPPVVLLPISYRCPRCSLIFDSPGERGDHLFTAHPYGKPALFLHGHELSTVGTVIHETIEVADLVIVNCEQLRLNGSVMASSDLFETLADCRQGFHVLELKNHDADVRIELNFSIASRDHLLRVEEIFGLLFSDNQLNVDDIRRFADECKMSTTANFYLEGICQYLYGVLAKDQRGDTQLRHAQYKERFNQALEALRHVNRPMANTIRAIINFSFNSFAQPAGLEYAPKLAAAAGKFLGWAGKSVSLPLHDDNFAQTRLPIDSASDQLLRWMALPASEACAELDELRQSYESSLWTAEDRTKAGVLWLHLAQVHKPTDEVKRVARSLLNDSKFAPYAEQVLEKTTK
jgi:hypothetical protein